MRPAVPDLSTFYLPSLPICLMLELCITDSLKFKFDGDIAVGFAVGLAHPPLRPPANAVCTQQDIVSQAPVY